MVKAICTTSETILPQEKNTPRVPSTDRICLVESKTPFLMEFRKRFQVIAIRKTPVGTLGIVTLVPEDGNELPEALGGVGKLPGKHGLEVRTARIQQYFEVTSYLESHVWHMAAAGGGIWISVHLDTQHLLHTETGQPLQEVELEPFISHTFGPSSVSLALNISALGAFGKRLWVGISGGTIISVPFVSEFTETTKTSPSAGIPLCAMEQAQISYHGHHDDVHFFVSVPGYADPSAAENLKDSHSQEKPSKPCRLVLNGREGYINLWIGDNPDKHYGDLLHSNPYLCRAE
ncbi:putative C-Jun-amino-terminal kinase-interacting protein [Naja naja]|nr:putative C-Jun-amino-terminal kinase-interacting protein [Naja naja]